MKKNILLTLIASICAVCAWAYDFESGDLYYNITSDSTVEVTYQEHWLSDNYWMLTSAAVPESVTYNDTTYSVTSIGERAFHDCRNLTSITIGNSVTSIGSSVFKNCSGLTSITIPNSVTSIGIFAFYDCSGLTSITIPNSVTSIGSSAFYNCSGLTSVTIGNGVTSIGGAAFSGCSGLTSITIPNSVTSIGSSAFYNCSGLTSVTIGNGVTSIGGAAFSGCSGLTSITIPNSVTSIGEKAFYDCSGLISVTIGNDVTSIGSAAFKGCSDLKSIVWNAKNHTDFSNRNTPFYYDSGYSDSKFDLRTQITSFVFGDSVQHIPAYICRGMNNLTSITIPNSVASIGDDAFFDCSGLASVTIGNSVTNIGNGAFSYCSGLTSIVVESGNTKYDSRNSCNAIIEIATNTLLVGCANTTIPNSVTSIGDYAFSYCRGIASITIPNSVTSIGEKAFSYCSSLSSITIPNSVTSIGDDAFYDCSSLKSVVWNAKNYKDFTNNNGPFCYGGFDLRPQITSFTFGDSVQHIPAYICSGMNNLTSITIPNSVTSIGDCAFCDCRGLTKTNYTGSIADWCKIHFANSWSNPIDESCNLFINDVLVTDLVIPEGITTINNYAFCSDTCLTSVTIPNSVTSIGISAFSGCSNQTLVVWNAKNCADFIYGSPFPHSITSFFFGDSVQSIPAYICSRMNNLTSITIPNSVTSISCSAFNGCSGLTSIAIPNSVTNIGNFVFADCSGLTSITLGNSVTNIGDSAFYKCSGLTSVTIPNNVTKIGEFVFYGCSGLKSIVWNAKNCADFSSYSTPFYCGNGYYSEFDVCPQITSFVFGDSVQHIPAWICRGMDNLTSVTIPNSVTSMGNGAFSYCRGLTFITIPNSITSIGNYAFRGCIGLSSIIIPNRVTSIGDYAFCDCSGLTSITIPNSITSIGNYAFRGCIGFSSITIPNSVTSIGDYAFYNCIGLTSVTIGNSVASIGKEAFYDCRNIASITIPNSVTSIEGNAFFDVLNIVYSGTATGAPWGARCMNGYVDGYLVYADVEKTTLLACSRAATEAISIPNSVTSIGNSAFSHCSGLASVTIGNSVTSIGSDAFSGCSGLTKTNYIGSIADWCRINFLDYVSNPIYYSRNLFINDVLVADLVIPEGITTINNYAFCCDTCLTSVTIPNSVTSIASGAFRGCSGLTSIAISNNVTSIGSYAFCGCSGLTSITIGNSVTSIGDDAFSGCSSLTKTNYTGSIADWCRITFSGHFSNPVHYSHNLFINDVLVTDLIIPEEITTINDYALCFDTCLTSVTIPNSVTDIGKDAFFRCRGLTFVTIGNSVTSIEYDAFYGCSGLTSITIPNSVTSIGDEAFKNCSRLTSVTIGNSVTSIGSEAFYGCSCLTSVTIGNSVTSIGYQAFYRCYGVRDITFKSFMPLECCSKNEAFRYCNNIENVYIPCGSKSNYVYAGWEETILTEVAPTISVATEDITRGTAKVDKQALLCDDYTIISANPTEYCHFVQWNDGNIDNPRTVFATEDVTYTARFALNQYTITTSADDGIISGVGMYDYGTEVTLMATPNDRYRFMQWSDGNTENPRTVVVSGNATYTAEFIALYEISTVYDQARGDVSGAGTYDYGTEATLTATPAEHYHFTRWNDGNTDNPRTVLVTEDVTYTAEFVLNQHVITVSAVNGDVLWPGLYDYGTEATLTAIPAEHYHFTQWSDGNTDNPRIVLVTEDVTYTAEFIPIGNITTVYDAKQGVVLGGGTYDYGTQVQLLVTPAEHYRFAQWSDGNTDNPRTVVVTGDTTYTAEFIAICNITVVYDVKQGYVSGDGIFDYGTRVRLVAEPNSGYEFSQWSDGTAFNPYIFAATEDITLEAMFIPTTAVENVKADKVDGVQKVLRDGQVLILRDGKMYNTIGQEME